jgi:prephenate dehydratase
MKPTVGYLGPEGTFTHEAACQMFSDQTVHMMPYPTIPDVLSAVDRGECTHGVIPVENAIEGAVNLTLDWLIHQVDVPIVGELVHPITQCLLVHPAQADRPKEAWSRIISHPQAVAQCQLHLRHHYPQAQVEFANSTAEAAEKVSRYPDEAWIAIGTRQAAKRYGLHILAADVQDFQNNYTRFIAVGAPLPARRTPPGQWKTSLCVTLASDFPGALHQVLATFAWRKINLTKIESRPTKTGLGNYYFIIDAEMEREHVLLKGAIAEIEAFGCQVRVLGSYPCYRSQSVQSLSR